jgi:hypothetical protein
MPPVDDAGLRVRHARSIAESRSVIFQMSLPSGVNGLPRGMSPVKLGAAAAARMSGKSLKLQPCSARSLRNFCRAVSASWLESEFIIACNRLMRWQISRGGRVMGCPHTAVSAPHRHKPAKSMSSMPAEVDTVLTREHGSSWRVGRSGDREPRPDRRVLHRCIGRARARSGQRFLSLEPIAVAFSAGITLRPGVLRATGEGR